MKTNVSILLALALAAGVHADPSPKRGIGFNEIAAADLAALSPGVSWAYNWGVGKPDAFNDPRAKGVEFIPMAWGPQQGFRDHLEAVLTTGPKPSAVLGLNEPNLRGQAFQSPEDAAKSWRELAAQCRRHGVPLVAPNMAMGTPEGDSWRGFDPVQKKEVVYTFVFPYLDAFEWYLREAGPEKAAAMGIHIYGNIWEMRWILGELAKRYPATPVWVTEFNWSGAPDEAAALDYLVQAVDALERAPNIARYAWFKADFGADRNSLIAPGGGLTKLGRLYVAMPHPDPKRWDAWPGVVKAAGAARVETGDGASIRYDPEAQVVVQIGEPDSGRTGSFTLQVDVAAPGGDGTLVLSAARGRTLRVAVDDPDVRAGRLPSAGGLEIKPFEPGKWGFQDYVLPLRLAPGRHTLTFSADAADALFDWISWK